MIPCLIEISARDKADLNLRKGTDSPEIKEKKYK